MPDENKDGLMKKIGKTAVKTGSDAVKDTIKGSVTAAAAGVVKEGIKQAAEASGLTEKADNSKSGIHGQLKAKENEIKKQVVKEAIKKSLK